ncbi:MAG: hypothetical protein KF851_10185 [Pirellulaceae bacterium]|nr:hypothetical protein [Pirellulaceae bacterium]
MKIIEQLGRLIALAEKMGYEIRHENLGGVGGGLCEFGGRRCLFIDLSLNSVEQLEQLRDALSRDPSLPTGRLPSVVLQDLGLPFAATSVPG